MPKTLCVIVITSRVGQTDGILLIADLDPNNHYKCHQMLETISFVIIEYITVMFIPMLWSTIAFCPELSNC